MGIGRHHGSLLIAELIADIGAEERLLDVPLDSEETVRARPTDRHVVPYGYALRRRLVATLSRSASAWISRPKPSALSKQSGNWRLRSRSKRKSSRQTWNLDGAAYLFLSKSFLRRTGELERCETFAGPAFDVTREDTGHCTFQRQWVEKLIDVSNFARADKVTLQYLEYLSGDDTSLTLSRIG
jgi:hypothetical protein